MISFSGDMASGFMCSNSSLLTLLLGGASTINIQAQHCQLRETPLVQPPLKGLFAADPQLSLGSSAWGGRCDWGSIVAWTLVNQLMANQRVSCKLHRHRSFGIEKNSSVISSDINWYQLMQDRFHNPSKVSSFVAPNGGPSHAPHIPHPSASKVEQLRQAPRVNHRLWTPPKKNLGKITMVK